MFEEGLGTLVTFNPVSVSVDTTLDEMLEMLDNSGMHHWPVVDDERQLVGVLSDKDILQAAMAQRSAALAVAGGVKGPSVPTSCRVDQIMSRRVLAIEHDDPPGAALKLMLDHQIHSLPVLQDGRLVGMITSTDFLREFSYGECEEFLEPVSRRLVRVTDFVDAGDTLDMAKWTMDAAGATHLAVMRGECPLGIVSRRDLQKAKCRQSARELLGHAPDETSQTVIHLMKAAPNVRPGERMSRAAAIMLENHVQAVAVVNQAARLLGIVTVEAILQAMHAHVQ